MKCDDLDMKVLSGNEYFESQWSADARQNRSPCWCVCRYFIFDIDSPDVRYLASITVENGKVFALLVKSPTKVSKWPVSEPLGPLRLSPK